ncbi:ABC transporter ATP-binding protein [Thermodesulfobacteriota bacterium]
MQTPLSVKQKIIHSIRIDRAISLVWQASPKWTIINALLVIVQGLIPLAALYLIKLIIDTISEAVQSGSVESAASHVILLVVIAACVAIVQVGVSRLASYVTEAQAITVTDYVHDVMHKKSIELDLAYYENPDYFDTLHRAQQEGPYRPTTIVNGLNMLGQNGVSLIVMVGLLFTFHWSVGLLLFVSTLPGLWVQIHFARKNFRWQKEITPAERRASYYSWLLTSDKNAKEVRLFDLGGFFSDGFNTLRAKIRDEKLSLLRQRTASEFFSQAFAALILMACFLMIGIRTLKGMITIGDMVMYFQAFQRGVNHLKELLQNLARLYEDNLFVSLFFSFLDAENRVVESSTPKELPATKPSSVELQHVSFSYPGAREAVLNDVSFTINPGEVVALVGPNGAGKSTIVKLLCRLYDPSAGVLSYNDSPYPDLALQELRQQISVVFQDFVQYHLTVRDNIRLGDVDKEVDCSVPVAHAAEKAGITRLVESLPKGYETMLGKWFEAGEELSIGEWQKLVIARAFYRDADFIILDVEFTRCRLRIPALLKLQGVDRK